jgi:hypothetical protein
MNMAPHLTGSFHSIGTGTRFKVDNNNFDLCKATKGTLTRHCSKFIACRIDFLADNELNHAA